MRKPAPSCCQPGVNAQGFTGWEMIEAEALAKKFKDCNENISQLTRHLGLTHPTVRKRLKKYGIITPKTHEQPTEPTADRIVPGPQEAVANPPDAVG